MVPDIDLQGHCMWVFFDPMRSGRHYPRIPLSLLWSPSQLQTTASTSAMKSVFAIQGHAQSAVYKTRQDMNYTTHLTLYWALLRSEVVISKIVTI